MNTPLWYPTGATLREGDKVSICELEFDTGVVLDWDSDGAVMIATKNGVRTCHYGRLDLIRRRSIFDDDARAYVSPSWGELQLEQKMEDARRLK